MVAKIVNDFEQALSSLVIRPFDDGRFIVRLDGATIFDKDRTGAFPKYDTEIKPRLAKRGT